MREEIRVVLVGIEKKNDINDYSASLGELANLAKTAGYTTVDTLTQNYNRINPKFLLSKGKVEELKQKIIFLKAKIVIFNDDINSSQYKNLEKYLNCLILDRCGLILMIFEEHARTKEAKVQVELARLNYDFSRLTGKWSHLSRQKGGIGLREVGEKQLEIDRRIVKNRIIKLKNKLKSIEKERNIQRKMRNQIFSAALVGYTNAGKSTIMNSLCGCTLLVEDKLFATLDSTTRILEDKNNIIKQKILLSDTVGFIDKLPHSLIASFKSTLDEIKYANLLIKVIDISSPSFENQMKIINETLTELKVNKTESFWVFNKIDLIDSEVVNNLTERYENSIFISAEKSIGLDNIKINIEKYSNERLVENSLLIGYDNIKIVSYIHSLAHVESKEYRKEGIFLTFKTAKDKIGLIEKKLKSNLTTS